MSGPAVKEPMTTGKERLQVAKYFRALRFDERTHLGLGDIRLTMGQQEDLIAEYEALVREREEAERKLADALQSVQSWQMEVLGRDSDIEQLLALLDEAPHSPACRKMDVQLKGAYSLACNCWKSRIPRAGD